VLNCIRCISSSLDAVHLLLKSAWPSENFFSRFESSLWGTMTKVLTQQ